MVDTPVTDAGLMNFKALTKLTYLDLRGTKVTAAGVDGLRKALPKCNIVSDFSGGDERKAAEWVLSIGGEVTIHADGQYRDCKTAKELPAGAFEVAKILLKGNQQVSDDRLANLKGLKNLVHLDLSGTRIGDAGVEHLQELPALVVLSVVKTQVGDAGLLHLRTLTNLQWLDLGRTQVSDVGLEHLKALTSLKELTLYETKVGDAGLVHLKSLTRLVKLTLAATEVSDAGLIHVAALTNLEILGLENNTRITDAGLGHLKALRNLRSLGLNATNVSNAGLVRLSELPNLEELGLDFTGISDAGLVDLKALTKLTQSRATVQRRSSMPLWHEIPCIRAVIAKEKPPDRSLCRGLAAGFQWCLSLG